MARTLFVVSANLPDGPVHDPTGPLKDYVAIARRLGADVLDWSRVRQEPSAGPIERTIGLAAAQAWPRIPATTSMTSSSPTASTSVSRSPCSSIESARVTH